MRKANNTPFLSLTATQECSFLTLTKRGSQMSGINSFFASFFSTLPGTESSCSFLFMFLSYLREASQVYSTAFGKAFGAAADNVDIDMAWQVCECDCIPLASFGGSAFNSEKTFGSPSPPPAVLNGKLVYRIFYCLPIPVFHFLLMTSLDSVLISGVLSWSSDVIARMRLCG